jgi:hypothetical protein
MYDKTVVRYRYRTSYGTKKVGSMFVCNMEERGSIVVLKDASSVRATHPIPASCGLYYFEVKIVSKGRDGYMGVGLSAHDVNMNRYKNPCAVLRTGTVRIVTFCLSGIGIVI